MKNSIYIILIILLCGCNSESVFSPKPRMFPKIEYPEKSYSSFQESYCNFTFMLPSYAKVVQDTSFFEETPVHPCWFDLVMSQFNGRLHCSYYEVKSKEGFDQLINDAFTFVEKHDIKANYRSETTLENKYGAGGILFEIEGPVASPLQFFLTDSTTHFLRASLYFNNKVAPDSIAPVFQFVKNDVLKMIETLRFEGS